MRELHFRREWQPEVVSICFLSVSQASLAALGLGKVEAERVQVMDWVQHIADVQLVGLCGEICRLEPFMSRDITGSPPCRSLIVLMNVLHG